MDILDRIKRKLGSSEEAIKQEADRLNVESNLPSFFWISVVCIGIILVIYAVLPLGGANLRAVSAGPLSKHHRFIEKSCESCHSGAFETVSDKNCESCHALTKHTDLNINPKFDHRCADCHFEHKGEEAILPRNDRLCLQCHKNISEIAKDGKALPILSLAKHPEFAVNVRSGLDNAKKPIFNHVRLDNIKDLLDETPIKLNHKIHLKEGIKGVDGPVTLHCQDCHKLSSDFKTIEPLTFEKNCRSCHSLGFDERLPDREVPHSIPDVVYNYIYSEYAKLALNPKANSGSEGNIFQRLRPGEIENTRTPKDVSFAKEAIEKETRSAEKTLFTKTGCYLCHNVNKLEYSDPGKSQYEIVAPALQTRWMLHANFSHGAHEELTCDSCHKGVKDSIKTSEVLLPKIETCQSCHTEKGGSSKVASNCVECHSYHDKEPLDNSKKRGIFSQ